MLRKLFPPKLNIPSEGFILIKKRIPRAAAWGFLENSSRLEVEEGDIMFYSINSNGIVGMNIRSCVSIDRFCSLFIYNRACYDTRYKYFYTTKKFKNQIVQNNIEIIGSDLNNFKFEQNESVHYFKNHTLHREDGPAISSPEGEIWLVNGQFHREDGPAIELVSKMQIPWSGPASTQYWYINGSPYNEEEFNSWRELKLGTKREISESEIEELIADISDEYDDYYLVLSRQFWEIEFWGKTPPNIYNLISTLNYRCSIYGYKITNLIVDNKSVTMSIK